MAALAHRIVTGLEHSAPRFAARIGTMLRRGATIRYAEQRDRIERTGSAGLI